MKLTMTQGSAGSICPLMRPSRAASDSKAPFADPVEPELYITVTISSCCGSDATLQVLFVKTSTRHLEVAENSIAFPQLVLSDMVVEI